MPEAERIADERWKRLESFIPPIEYAELTDPGRAPGVVKARDDLAALRSEYEAMRDLLDRLVAALNTDGLTDYDDIDEIGDEAAALLNLERSRR